MSPGEFERLSNVSSVAAKTEKDGGFEISLHRSLQEQISEIQQEILEIWKEMHQAFEFFSGMRRTTSAAPQQMLSRDLPRSISSNAKLAVPSHLQPESAYLEPQKVALPSPYSSAEPIYADTNVQQRSGWANAIQLY